MIEYRLKRSRRKSIAIEVSPDGVLVRAPSYAPLNDIEEFIRSREDWIRKNLEKMQAETEGVEKLTRRELQELAEKAKNYIPKRCRYYAEKLGVHYGRITIRNQRTRWGSCSAKGNLNFNCLLMLTPPEVIDSVVVHELCHLYYMNHSRDFYERVYSVFPDYDKYNAWLKDHTRELMARNI